MAVEYPPLAVRSATVPRTRAQDDLVVLWAAWKAAAFYVQTLDQPIVAVPVWDHAYAGARQVLDAAATRLTTWKGPYSPAASLQLRELRDVLIAYLSLAEESVAACNWNASMAYLWKAGIITYAWATAFGLEVYP